MPFRLTGFSIFIAILFLLPWLALIGLGAYWLWLNHWLFYGVAVLSANSALVYALMYWRNRKAESLFIEPFSISPNPNWSHQSQAAFEALQPLTERWQNETKLFTQPNKALTLTNEVLTTVAQQFHTESKYPILEFPLPYLLKLIVLVCEDMQHEVLDKIPGSHAVRVGDLLRAKQMLDTVNQLQAIINIGNWLFNWSGAALAKARSLLFKKGLTKVSDEICRRLIHAYINKLGYYAIQLYSGQITLEDIVPTEQLSPDSQTNIAASAKHEQTIEPLRFLVLGQVSSGKSTLINALFGEIKAAESPLPTTAKITPYISEREGLQQAIILDSAGYAGLAHTDAPVALKQEWAKVDVILLVCNAAQAARQADAEQLNAIRAYFQQQCPNQALPVVLAVVTQIDRLRPLREWQPPYNIEHPSTAKAASIRQACEAIAQELNLPLDCVVPVCLAPEFSAYNIDDGLIPLIHSHLNEAQRVRYLRCLRQYQQQSYWQQWHKQARKLGQIILKHG